LWILDAAAPALSFLVPGGPKAVRVNLGTNQVVGFYPFDEQVAPQGTYLNDIRFTPDVRTAVISNSGQPGSLIVLDVASGQARRVLDGHPSTQFQKDIVITVGGRQLRMLDGQPPHFSADGIIVDQKGEYVYWQATTGIVMYRSPLAALLDPTLSSAQQGASLESFANTFVADGYWLARNGALYLTSDEDSSVKRLSSNRQFSVQVQDSRLLWPDSMAEGPDGAIYVTASHIPQMKMWQGPGIKQTQLFRFQPT
jgi:sugar lactone lactonase YvrE